MYHSMHYRTPGFVIGQQCVSVLETFPLWKTFWSSKGTIYSAPMLILMFLYGIELTDVCR